MRIKIKLIYFLAALLFSALLSAQPGSQVIFTYEGSPVTVEEFEYQYLKNKKLGEEAITEKDIDEYLDLYVKFKLKYRDAKDAGMDTLKDYITELAGYRSQLARNYLYDKEVTDGLIQEAYERMKWEVRAAHILIAVDMDAKPQDSLAAFNKLKEAINRINAGSSTFEDEARRISDDPGSKDNGGDLGYFTALQLVYPFETVAYNTETGKVSAIFRTQFGYHIIKVLDKRANRGDIKVRHIQLRVGHKPEATDAAVKKNIDDIYKKIVSGESTFDNMAISYSEDFNSRERGGEMDYINVTQFVGDVERQRWVDMAFGLKADGEMSKVFRTDMGYHILQRMAVRPLAGFDQLKSLIKNQVRNDQRSQKSADVLVEKVKAENKYTEFSGAFNALLNSLDTNYAAGSFKKSQLPTYGINSKPAKPVRGNVFLEPNLSLLELELFHLGGEKHTVSEFADYMEKNTRPVYGNVEESLKTLYNRWVSETCVNYQDRHLEEKSVEFRNIYQEYSEGILMFYRKKEIVWDRANTDSAGLANFFSQNRTKYMWKDRINCQFYFCATDTVMNAVAKQIKKKIDPDSIQRVHNLKKPLSVGYKAGKYEITDNYLFADKTLLPALFANPKSKKKKSIIKMGRYGADWVVVKVIEFKPVSMKELLETRGPVTAQYEEYLEAIWIAELQNRYKVVVDQAVMAELKKKLLAK